jgi:hypothetical protein
VKLIERAKEGFLRNPFAWALLALWLLAQYHLRERDQDIDRICELLGPHDAEIVPPHTPGEEIDNICIRNQPDDDFEDQ